MTSPGTIPPNLLLSNGKRIPQLGFGTYKVTDHAQRVVNDALKVGYRHIDGAQMYGNELEVGLAVAESGIVRDSLFLTSKLDNPNHEPDVAKRSFERTLMELQTDYVDLFLIHWPLPMYYDGDFGRTWRVMEGFYEEGSAKAIGVSNFEPHHLEKLALTANIAPMVNQIESHPYFPNTEVHQYNSEHGILTEAWSPLARGRAISDPILIEIGEQYGKSPSQVAIRWGLQRGDILIPKASSTKRQLENLHVFDFELSSTDMERIFRLDEGEPGRTGKHPDKMDRL